MNHTKKTRLTCLLHIVTSLLWPPTIGEKSKGQASLENEITQYQWWQGNADLDMAESEAVSCISNIVYAQSIITEEKRTHN